MRHQHGLTILELVLALSIAAVLVLVGMNYVVHQSKQFKMMELHKSVNGLLYAMNDYYVANCVASSGQPLPPTTLDALHQQGYLNEYDYKQLKNNQYKLTFTLGVKKSAKQTGSGKPIYWVQVSTTVPANKQYKNLLAQLKTQLQPNQTTGNVLTWYMMVHLMRSSFDDLNQQHFKDELSFTQACYQ